MLKIIDFVSYETSVPRILDLIKAGEILSKQSRIVLKPNLTCNKPPPVTTSARLVEEVLKYCLAHSNQVG